MSRMWTVLLFSLSLGNAVCGYTPIVIWHAMGDYCSNHNNVLFVNWLEGILPGVYVTCLKIGNNTIEEVGNGFTMHPNKQVDMACNIIQSDPALSNGYHAIGFSQGSQLLRAVAQRCPTPEMKNFVSLGGQHQGVYGLPLCDVLTSKICNTLRLFLNYFAYTKYFQEALVQATYWQDPLHHNDYVKGSTFLAEINNEKWINEIYIKNLQSIQNLIFVKFESDEMVQPKESQWFGFYKIGQSSETVSLQNSSVYTRLGMDEMDAKGKLHFLSHPGKHLQFEWAWFEENIVKKFFV